MKNRTIIGIVCMILAVAMTFAVAPLVNRLTSDTTMVVRLKQEVGRGAKITAEQVETVKVKTDTMPQGVYVNTADVIGKYASSTLYAGDILTKAKLTKDANSADDVFATLDGEEGYCPAKKVDVKDTTGAGDAFFAGTVIGQTYGKTMMESCEIGTRLAASVITTGENVCPRYLPSEFGLDASAPDDAQLALEL